MLKEKSDDNEEFALTMKFKVITKKQLVHLGFILELYNTLQSFI